MRANGTCLSINNCRLLSKRNSSDSRSGVLDTDEPINKGGLQGAISPVEQAMVQLLQASDAKPHVASSCEHVDAKLLGQDKAEADVEPAGQE